MKKNKLYIANKWNQPAFIQERNLFPDGGSTNPFGVTLTPPALIGPYNSWMSPTQKIQAQVQMQNLGTTAASTQQQLSNFASKENALKNPFNFKEAFSKEGLKNGLKAGIGAAISGMSSVVGGLAGNALAGGLSSGAGNTINNIGSNVGAAVGSVNPLLGGAVSIGSSLIGGLTNRMFGTKVDQAKLDAVNAGTDALRNFTSTATSLDDVQGPDAVAKVLDPYSGGWFSSGEAARKNEELRRQRADAKSWAERGVVNNIDNLVKSQMDDVLAGYAAFGGPLHSNGLDWNNGLTFIDQGGTHEENPYGGVQIGIAPDGQPNLVEEGEVIWNDYVFSRRLRVPKAVRDKYKLRGAKDLTFADAAKNVQKESEERPNDPISQRGLEDIMDKLMMEQEKIRSRRNKEGNKFAKGGPFGNITFTPPRRLSRPINWGNPVERARAMGELPVKFDTDYTDLLPRQRYSWEELWPVPTLEIPNTNLRKAESSNRGSGKYNPLTALRYVPALGAGIGVFSDLMGWTNKPDYSNANMILDASRNVRDISYKPIGDYLTYRPLDRLFYSNILGAQAGATRRNILNTSGGNRGTAMAGLLAADYNAQNQLGNLFRQAEEYNLAQRQKVADFNRATNMFNSEADLKAQMANTDIGRLRLDATKTAAGLRQAADAQSSAARSANLTNLFDSLGNIGREEVMKSWINENPALYYAISNSGAGTPFKKSKSKGGYLTIKRRK